jgi:hypothetical protein
LIRESETNNRTLGYLTIKVTTPGLSTINPTPGDPGSSPGVITTAEIEVRDDS